MEITIHSDGGARGNPGPSGIGVVIREGEKVVEEVSKFLGDQTNNWAEYEAIRIGLEAVATRYKGAASGLSVRAFLDSELVVRQLNGLYKVKEPALIDQHAKVKECIAHFKSVEFTHIPREKNQDADRLANEAMDHGA